MQAWVTQRLDKVLREFTIHTRYMIFTKSIIWKALVASLFGLFGIVAIYQIRTRVNYNRNMTRLFYQNEVSGNLASVEGVSGGFVRIKFTNGKEFIFCPSGNEITFKDFVKAGDSINKPSFSNYLMVYKNDKGFFFNFLKP